MLKNTNKLIAILLVIIAIYSISICCIKILNHNNFAYSYYGSRGSEVIEIQKRLYNWGYYKGPIDGIFGYKTYTSIKYFQRKNNLNVDGIAGSKTLASLGINSKSSGSNSTSYSRDLNLLAHLVHGEARGEPYLGQVAVASVVLNRVRNSNFPKTVASVIYQTAAFDAVSDGQINLPANNTSYNAARDALNGWDPSQGCIYYFNPSTATNKWIWSRQIVQRIGKHYFAK